MTDRAEPGVTPDGRLRRVLDDRENDAVWVARDAILSAVAADRLDAATPRPGLVEAALGVALDRLTVYVDHLERLDDADYSEDREFIREARALASGTGEPGLDRAAILTAFHGLAVMEGSDGHRYVRRDHASAVIQRLANDKGADPTPEPK